MYFVLYRRMYVKGASWFVGCVLCVVCDVVADPSVALLLSYVVSVSHESCTPNILILIDE